MSIRDEALLVGTKVTTKAGDKNIENITLEDEVLQFDMNTKDFSYTNPTKTQKVIRDEIYHFEGAGFDQKVSPNHRMIYEQGGEIKECLAKDFEPSEDKYFIIVEGSHMQIKRIKSTDVKITHTKLDEPTEFHALSVPGKSFVVTDEHGNRSVTGASMHVEGKLGG
uniref:AceL NrdHF-1-1 Intein n=1 Tax=metagenome TaxID=256318 RepID=UPI00165EBE0D